MENPKTWGTAQNIIAAAIAEHHTASEAGVYGISLPTRIYNALRDAGLLVEETETHELTITDEWWQENKCPCCKQVLGCYCHEYPHADNPLCPGNPDRVAEWVNSEEGKQAIQDAAERAKQMSEELRTASRVNPDDLNKPMTI